jgi:hypothetical protein
MAIGYIWLFLTYVSHVVNVGGVAERSKFLYGYCLVIGN